MNATLDFFSIFELQKKKIDLLTTKECLCHN